MFRRMLDAEWNLAGHTSNRPEGGIGLDFIRLSSTEEVHMAKRRKAAAKKPARKRKVTRTATKRKKTAKKTSVLKRARRRVRRAVTSMMP
jgi:hypothetical protein